MRMMGGDGRGLAPRVARLEAPPTWEYGGESTGGTSADTSREMAPAIRVACDRRSGTKWSMLRRCSELPVGTEDFTTY